MDIFGKIDIRQFLILSLSSNDYLHEEIDRIYEENKLEYYDCYKKSNYVDDRMFQRFTVIKYEHMKKCAGIVQWDYLHETDEHIYYLIKKGYKIVWNYCKNKDYINLDIFGQYYLNKKGGCDKISELELFCGWIIALYLCIKEKIRYNEDGFLLKEMLKNLTSMMKECFIDEIVLNKETMNEYRNEIEKLYDKYFIPKNEKQTIDNLFEDIIITQMKNTYSEEELMNKSVVLDLRHETFSQGISRYIGALSGLLKAFNINEMDLMTSYTISKKDLDKLLLNYLIAKEDNNLLETDEALFIVTTIVIKNLAEEYKRTKNIYLNKTQDEFYYQLHKINEELEQKDKDLKNKEELLKLENIKTQQENDKLWEELKRLQKQNNDYKKQIDSMDNNNKEVFALRNYMFSKENNIDFEDNIITDSFDIMIDYLKTKKCAIIGGHSIWINKIKEILPNFIFMNPDNMNKDVKFVDNVEAVFINTLVNSHAFYEKVMAKMNRNNTKLFYIDNITNIELSIKTIYGLLSI